MKHRSILNPAHIAQSDVERLKSVNTQLLEALKLSLVYVRAFPNSNAHDLRTIEAAIQAAEEGK